MKNGIEKNDIFSRNGYWLVDQILDSNANMIDEFKSGKEKAFNALVGQVMKASKGKANPSQVNEILKKKLSN